MKKVLMVVCLCAFSAMLIFGQMRIDRVSFGKMGDETIYLYTLTNENHMTVWITNYGGIFQSILVPDKVGILADVVLGFSDLDDYIRDTASFGCIVGGYANRIAQGRFNIDGVTYYLTQNEGTNCLHGGWTFQHFKWRYMEDAIDHHGLIYYGPNP